jgi:hypothetical protein
LALRYPPAVSRPLGQAAEKGGKAEYAVDPSNPQIAPTIIPWKEYKNEYYEKRGYDVVGKDWKVRAAAGRRRGGWLGTALYGSGRGLLR